MSYSNITEHYTTAAARLLQAYKDFVANPVWNSPQGKHFAETVWEIKTNDFSPAKLTTYRGIADYIKPVHPISHVNIKYIVDYHFKNRKDGEKS